VYTRRFSRSTNVQFGVRLPFNPKTVARIVIVEDKAEERLLLRNILEGAGHDTYATQDLQQILNYCRGGIDLIFTALQMQGVHGLEIIMAVREHAPDVSVIAVSATGPEQLEMAEAIGAVMTFRKPVEPKLILAAVDLVTGKGRK
jgi:CheY-like chemotaxis protein